MCLEFFESHRYVAKYLHFSVTKNFDLYHDVQWTADLLDQQKCKPKQKERTITVIECTSSLGKHSLLLVLSCQLSICAGGKFDLLC